MSIFLYFLFEVCGLYVWACASGVSYNLCFNTPLCCNTQTACSCWISCFWVTALWLSPSLSVSKGQVSRGMPVWAKNAENVEESLRLDRRVQGVRLEFVAIDSILVEAQWRITLNVTQIGRAAAVLYVQYISNKGENRIFIYTVIEQDMLMQFSFIFTVAPSDWPSPSPPPLTISVSSGLPMRVPDWWLQVKHFGGGPSDKRSLGVLFKSLSPSPTSERTAWGY